MTKTTPFTCTILIDIYSSSGNSETIFYFFTNNTNTPLVIVEINPRKNVKIRFREYKFTRKLISLIIS